MNEDAKTFYWKSIDRRRAGYIGRGKRLVNSALQEQIKPVIEAVENSSDPTSAFGALQYFDRKVIQDMFMNLYKMVGTEFARETFNGLTSQKSAKKDYQIKRDLIPSGSDNLTENIWLTFIEKYVREQAATRITGITNTGIKKVRQVLENGVKEGLPVQKIARQLRSEWQQVTRWRGEMIARTEIISASNLGSNIGAETTGLRLNKEWISTRDDRTRDDHIVLDGVVIGMQQSFNVGGADLQFPAEPGGPADQVINCRCTIAHVPVD